MNDKIIPFRKKSIFVKFKDKLFSKLQSYIKDSEVKRMLFIIIIIGVIIGLFSWHYFVENVARNDVNIPNSQNITFNNEIAKAIDVNDIRQEFSASLSRPILLYFYTSWCSKCKKTTPIINELAREFQATDLKVIAVAIDKNIDAKFLGQYLNNYGDIYFEPSFLTSKVGFIEFLRERGVRYNKRIPYSILFSANMEVVANFSGSKSKNYLRNKIIKELNL